MLGFLPPFDQTKKSPCQHFQPSDFGNLKLSPEFTWVTRGRKGRGRGIRRMFILVSSYGSGGQQGKRERKHQEPSSGFGDPKKRSLFPTRYSHQQTESLPLSLSPTLCLSPPTSLSSLLFPFSLHHPPHHLPPFSSQGPKGEGRAEKVALPSLLD